MDKGCILVTLLMWMVGNALKCSEGSLLELTQTGGSTQHSNRTTLTALVCKECA